MDDETDTDELFASGRIDHDNDSENLDHDGEDIFEEFNKRSEIKVAALLRETENKLYRTFEKGDDEDDGEKDVKVSRRYILERRHNFETHNRPQCNHITPKFSEWTSQFTYLRVCGEQLALTPVDVISDSEQDERYGVDIKSERADRESLVIEGRKVCALYRRNVCDEEIVMSHGIVEEIIEINYHDEAFNPSQVPDEDFVDPIPSTEMAVVKNEIREEIFQYTWETIVPALSSILKHIAKHSIAESVYETRANSAPVGSAARLCFSRTQDSIERRRNPFNRFKRGGGMPQLRIKQHNRIADSATTPTTIRETPIKQRFRMYSPQKVSTIKTRIKKKET